MHESAGAAAAGAAALESIQAMHAAVKFVQGAAAIIFLYYYNYNVTNYDYNLTYYDGGAGVDPGAAVKFVQGAATIKIK